MIMIVLLDEVEEDAGAFEDADFLFLAIRCLEYVRDGWLGIWSEYAFPGGYCRKAHNAAIRVYVCKPLLLLYVRGDGNGVEII